MIPHSLPASFGTARGKALPGGYRSYGGAGGFRPTWALGTHSNPCILWQYPHAWRVVESSDSRVIVETSLDLYHVAYRRRISIERGKPGFICEVEAVNKLPAPAVAAGFSFNLVLDLDAEAAAWLEFAWEADRRQRLSLREAATTLVRLPARECLAVNSPRWVVTIRSDPAETAGYWADWSAGSYVTPDLHGMYRSREPGQTTTVRWEFAAEPR